MATAANTAEPWSPAVRGSSLRVDVAEVLEDSKAALQLVLEATPGWGPEAAAAARVEQVSGAMTNLVYRCTSPAAAANATVIVRVFGTGGKLFSQKDERNIFLLASDLGLGPKCLVEYGNGRVEEFLPGDNLSCDSMRAPATSAAIAAALAVFHVRMLARLPAAQGLAAAPGMAAPGAGGSGIGDAGGSGSGKGTSADGRAQQAAPAGLRPAIYDRIQQWYAAAQEVCGAELKQLGLANIPEELAALEAHLAARYPAWVGFCHNDLQYGNMLLFGSSTGGTASSAADAATAAAAAAAAAGTAAAAAQEGGAAAGVGTAAAAADGGSPAANGAAGEGDSPGEAAADADGAGGKASDADGGSAAGPLSIKLIDYEYSTLNDVSYDLANHFCEWAYNYHSDEAHLFRDDRLPSQEQLLLRKAQAHLPLVHLKWGLWGLIQDQMSDVDFDYLAYGKQRIERYHATKCALLGQQGRAEGHSTRGEAVGGTDAAQPKPPFTLPCCTTLQFTCCP